MSESTASLLMSQGSLKEWRERQRSQQSEGESLHNSERRALRRMGRQRRRRSKLGGSAE